MNIVPHLENSSTGKLERQNSTNNAAHVATNSLNANAGGTTERVSISSTTAESSAITAGSVVVTPSVDCFFRYGDTGLTAVVPVAGGANGDIPLLAGNTYRISGIPSGKVLGFITAGASGYIDITPGG